MVGEIHQLPIAVVKPDHSVKIREAIANTKDLECVTGKTNFDKNGDPIKSAIIKTVTSGKFKFVDVVNPK